MTPLRWTPTFMYGLNLDIVLTLQLPVGPWDFTVPAEGGGRMTADGAPGNWMLWQKHLLTLPLRFYETEWPDVRPLIEWGQTKASFIWVPESNPELVAVDQPTSFIVTLDAPRVNETVSPQPEAMYPRVLSLPIVLRQLNLVES